ncbi:PREDICTED: metallothionein 20-III-like [Branchiostoma belcheri]|uniref:Metallothionein 20-III-like n=1 Tax=Branchiostoma belcheri TaxID=7741 RepID=A0A6P4Z3K9_BRABE|nr:PREDICTED: metallothionein 20-III-like [Branchiostoma belcheri]
MPDPCNCAQSGACSCAGGTCQCGDDCRCGDGCKCVGCKLHGNVSVTCCAMCTGKVKNCACGCSCCQPAAPAVVNMTTPPAAHL